MKINFFENLSLRHEKEYFVTNLSMLLGAGMNVIDSIEAIRKETNSKLMKNVLLKLRDDIKNGLSFSRALAGTRLFSDQSISLIKIGEESGKLAANLQIIAVSEEKKHAFKSKIRSAMVYPGFVFGVTVVVGLVVIWYILPRLASVFAQLRVKLPLLTQILIATGNFLEDYGFFIVPLVLFLLFAFIYFLFYFPKTKHLGQEFLMILPGIGKIFREIELAHMGYILGTLLSAGIPVVPAINSLAEATNSLTHRKFYLKIKESIAEGNSFSKSFSNLKQTNKFIPKTIEQLIVAGEQSGRLPETFLKINQHYEGQTDETTKNLSVIFEPILLVVVWVGVVTVALSVILPIYSLIGGFNK